MPGGGISPRDALINSIIHRESGGNPKARGKKGELGLMQLMPQTAAMYGKYTPEQLLDPTTNREIGTRYFTDLLKRYKGDEFRALVAYNSGPGNVDKGRFVPGAAKYAADVLANANNPMQRIQAQPPPVQGPPGLPQQPNPQQFAGIQLPPPPMGEISNIENPWERRALEAGGMGNELGQALGSKSFGQGLGDLAYEDMPRSSAGVVADVGLTATPILGEELRMAGQGIKDLPVRRTLFKIAGALRGAETNPVVKRLTGELRTLINHLNPEGTAQAEEPPPGVTGVHATGGAAPSAIPKGIMNLRNVPYGTKVTLRAGPVSITRGPTETAGEETFQQKQASVRNNLLPKLEELQELYNNVIGPKIKAGKISPMGQGLEYTAPTMMREFNQNIDPDVANYITKAGVISGLLNSYYGQVGGARPGIQFGEKITLPHAPHAPEGVREVVGPPLYWGNQWDLQKQGENIPQIIHSVRQDAGLEPQQHFPKWTPAEQDLLEKYGR